MAQEQDSDQDTVVFHLGAHADKTVSLPGRGGERVDVPQWFDAALKHQDWADEMLISLVVDQDKGPTIAGLLLRGTTKTRAEVTKLLRSAVAPATLEEFVQDLTARSAGALAVQRLLATHPDRAKIIENATPEQITTLRDAYADRARPSTRPQRRRLVTEDHLRRVADIYREALGAGKPPTAAVKDAFQMTHSTAARWVREARKAGILGPSQGTKPGEAPTPSE